MPLCSVVLVVGNLSRPLAPLARRAIHGRRVVPLPHKDVAPSTPVLALPPAAAPVPTVGAAPHDAERARVGVPRIRRGGEGEAALDLQAGVAGEVAHVPEGVGLALEKGDDDGATRLGGQGAQGRGEEGHEQGLVVADLAVHVGRLAADVGEVEEYAGRRGPRAGGGEGLGGVDVVDDLGGRLRRGPAWRWRRRCLLLFRLVLVLVIPWFPAVLALLLGRARRRPGQHGLHVLRSVRVLLQQLGLGLFEDRGRDVAAEVVPHEAGREAQVALAHEEYPVVSAKRNHRRRLRRLLVLVLLWLPAAAASSFSLGLSGLLRFPGRRVVTARGRCVGVVGPALLGHCGVEDFPFSSLSLFLSLSLYVSFCLASLLFGGWGQTLEKTELEVEKKKGFPTKMSGGFFYGLCIIDR